eukprot:6464954-Pyramimonas_sp.AAC.1
MPPWAPVRADVAATSALLFMSRTVTMRDGIVGFVPYTSGHPNCARLALGGLDLLRTSEEEQEAYRRCKTARQTDLSVMLAGPKEREVGESGELDTG